VEADFLEAAKHLALQKVSQVASLINYHLLFGLRQLFGAN
jgi:hypothetical protein